jgi:tetratricopeptide (TPR) repeat protein
MTDDELAQTIEEARSSAVGRRDIAVLHPGSLLPDVYLTIVAVDSRCEQIASLRNQTTMAERAVCDQRLARWHGVAADCLNLQGRMQLLLPRPGDAFDSFMLAEMRARALPDEGRLRLRQILEAVYGRKICGQMLRQPGVISDSVAGIRDLIENAGEPDKAESYLGEIEEQFREIERILAERIVREAAGEAVYFADSPEYDYFVCIERLAPAVEQNEMSIEDAVARLVVEVRLELVRPLCIHAATFLHRRLAQTPAELEIRAQLNYAAATHVSGPRAELARGFTALALGDALVERSRVPGGEFIGTYNAYRIDQDAYNGALPYLEEAWRSFRQSTYLETQRAAGAVALRPMIAYRGLRQFDLAGHFSEEAVALLEQIVEKGGAGPDVLTDLGVAHGNLGDIWEQIGRSEDGLLKHYQAFQLFSDAADIGKARQALHIIFDRSVILGHYDLAMAACERLIPLLEMPGAGLGAIRNYLDLARLAARTQPDRVAAILGRVQPRLQMLLDDPDASDDVVRLQFDLLLQQTNAFIQEYRIQPSPELHDRIADVLKQAGGVAEHLDHPDYAGTVYLYWAMLGEYAGDLDAAERYCRVIEGLSVSDFLQRRTADVLGSVQLRKEEYLAAAANLEKSLPAYRDDGLSLSLVQYRIGKALLSSPLFNPLWSWEWLERSKARTFAELLADTPLELAQLSGELADLYGKAEEKQEQLRQLNADARAARVYAYDGCEPAAHRVMPKNVA